MASTRGGDGAVITKDDFGVLREGRKLSEP